MVNRNYVKPKIYHIIPKANLGGIEKDLLYILKQESGTFQHRILVLDVEGPMSSVWEGLGADVEHLSILYAKPIHFINVLQQAVQNPVGIMCWSPTKMGWMGFALRQFKGRVMMHLGNPVDWSNKSTIVNRFLFAIAKPKFQLKLFCCSKHVLNSVKSNPFLNKFAAEVSYNPVEQRDSNPFKHCEKPVLGMIARMDSIKDFRTVIHAIPLLKTEVELRLGGDGKDRAFLEALANNTSPKNIYFDGFVHDVYAWMANLTCFVYGTTMQEGLGNVVTEAMANGLPCVLPDLPMMHEIAGEFALYYEQGNPEDCAQKINTLLSSTPLQQQFSEGVFLRAKNIFNQKTYYQQRVGFLEGKS